MKNKKAAKSKPTSFIRKTYKMLSKSKNSEIVSWSEAGKNFIIHDQHQFTNVILPSYFKHKNFASFNRQLNMYGFHKTREDALEFSHPLFQRNNESLLLEIHRKITEPTIFKETTSDLGNRLKNFQNQQNKMEDMLENLEKQYDEIMKQNQVLICELIQSKQREKTIEKYIESFKNREKSVKDDSGNDRDYAKEDFIRFSPLSEDE